MASCLAPIKLFWALEMRWPIVMVWTKKSSTFKSSPPTDSLPQQTFFPHIALGASGFFSCFSTTGTIETLCAGNGAKHYKTIGKIKYWARILLPSFCTVVCNRKFTIFIHIFSVPPFYILHFYTFYITNVFFAPSQSLCTFILVLTY